MFKRSRSRAIIPPCLNTSTGGPGGPTPQPSSRRHNSDYFLRGLRNYQLREELLVTFYRCSVESIITYCICVWFSSCTAAERKALQQVVNSAQKIIGCPLPSLEELCNTRCLKKATKISKDPSHPGNEHFVLLRSGKRFRTTAARTTRLKCSF